MRLVCDATLVAVAERDGDTVGSAQAPSIPAATRRAVEIRDHGRCRWAGCSSGRVDVHHIRERSKRGPHTVDNLLLLCRHHHRAVHEGGYRIEGPATNAAFRRPDGIMLCPMEATPRPEGGGLGSTLSALGVAVGPEAIRSKAAGELLDLDLTLWALLTHQQECSAEHS